ncbi:MAG: dienelactone hydrolase family protein [Chloroflexi bacterium]|nr:dienelactone hydrolase family protein [Chloroflexota bacterium]
MSAETIEQIGQRVQEYFETQAFKDGLDYATLALPQHPENFPLINYWRACFAARLGQPALACQILETTLVNDAWYSEMILRQSPSFTALQGDAAFERLVEISQKMQAADRRDALPLMVLRAQEACGPDAPGCPAVFFLHGNQDSVQANLPRWSHLAQEGWLVAMPQSSRAFWAGSYAWADYESAAEEVTGRYASLARQYSIDPEQVVLAGFSMGAEIALALALSGRIQAQGFILLGPGGPYMDDLSQWQPLLEQGVARGLRGLVITGAEDATIPHDNIRELVERLNQHGVAAELEVHPNLGHEYPSDFEERLDYALKYIFG